MWNLAAPPGFQGLREDKDLTIYIRHLPHWRQEGATYFATFRLGDSLPQSKLRELTDWRKEWEQCHEQPRSTEVW
jgi:putative transposase